MEECYSIPIYDDVIESLLRTISIVPWQVEELTEDQVAAYKEAFAFFDKNADGHVTVSGLKNVMKTLGMCPTDAEVKDLISEIDSDGSGTIEFSEFVTMMARMTKDSDTEAEIQAAFQIFDKNRDGVISTAELRYVMVRLGERVSDNLIQGLLDEMDLNGDGVINYEEFLKMLRT